MNIFNVFRAPEWWGYKLPPLLSVAYGTTLMADNELYPVSPYFLFFLLSLAIGAVYVSIINDFTDLREDAAVGKANRMENLAPWLRWGMVVGCLTAGIFLGYFMWPDKLTVSLYTCAWISFTLYSVPPFRFKKRGILGVICDASGAHLFPSLFMISGISYVMNVNVDYYWFALVGIWALSFGCRGILWHQFLDRENDIKTNISTLATRVDPQKFKPVAVVLFCIELAAFLGMLMHINLSAVWILLILYIVLVTIRYTRYANIPIILITPDNKHSQVLMLDCYQTFFPLGLLFSASFSQPFAWVVLAVHIVLFPTNIMIPLRDYWMAIAALYRQIRYSS